MPKCKWCKRHCAIEPYWGIRCTLGFQFLNEDIAPSPVMTGHQSGIITLSLKEADDAALAPRPARNNPPHAPRRAGFF